MKLSLNSNKKLNQKEYGTLMKKRVFNAKLLEYWLSAAKGAFLARW